MTIAQHTSDRLVVESNGTTLRLDKQSKEAELQRKGLLWKPKPVTERLANVSDVEVSAAVDRASGVEICSTMIVFKDGAAWALGARDRDEAEKNAETMRKFLGLH